MKHPNHRSSRSVWEDRVSRITDSIFVGEIMTRSHSGFMAGVGIDTVISILSVEHQSKYGVFHPVSKRFVHHTYPYDDGDTIPPETMLEIVESFGTVTLVHCISGSNRSTAVTLARLLYEGADPITACHRYWTERGAQLAKVYRTTPRMSDAMLSNLLEFQRFLVSR